MSQAEEDKKLKFRRSVVAKADLKKGHVLAPEDLAFKRPGKGISPDEADYVIGRILRRDLRHDQVLDWQDLV